MRWSASKWVGLILGVAMLAPTSAAVATELPDPDVPEFGEYELVPLLADVPAYAGPSTPTSLDGVHIGHPGSESLTPKARERLAEQGFVIVPSRERLFHDVYSDYSWDGTPTFVTTDAAYHTWHLVFDKLLRETEQRRLLPALERLVEGMRQNAAAQEAELAGSVLADDAARVHDLLATTSVVLGLPGVELSDRAVAERDLITEHARSTRSPILETLTDYSLFTPRGHYTRNKDLERYFRAMSVLGQHAFGLPGARDPDGDVKAKPDGLRRAVLAARTLVGHPELEALWQQIFEPTAFLVGVSDDYTPFELQAAVEATTPGGWADPALVADDERLATVADVLTHERPVRIDPERPAVRLMGTRFVLDSWILDQLVGPNVGTRSDPRVLGSPLDLAAAFGSDFALAIQDDAGETAKLHYPEQMEAMRTAVAARPDEAWGRTVYDAWLAAVEPMWLPRGEAFPDFMRSDAWRTKAQQTGFASYAELKHDTILYTKQAFGDTGGGVAPEPVRHWVEPDPVPFGRLAAVARLTRDGLLARDLLPKAQREMLAEYIGMADRLARIAATELAGESVTKRDNEWLSSIHYALESLWVQSGDKGKKSWEPDLDEDAAIIADIMRGLDPLKGADVVLEIGTGYIDRIFVIVPGYEEEDFRVAVGGVYSYYEFPWPTPERLSDERWREMLATGEAPARPAWGAPLFPAAGKGAGGAPGPTPKPTRADIEWELGETIPNATWKPYRKSPAGVAFDPFEAGARTGVIFDGLERQLHKAVDYVVLFRFTSAEGLEAYWGQRARAASAARPRAGACLDGRPGVGTWEHGQVLCYVSDRGTALLRWTDERTDTYGTMNGVAGKGRLQTVAQLWGSVVSP